MELPEGIVAVVKRDCPTCTLVAPVLACIDAEVGVTVYTQDDPGFPDGVGRVVDDTALEVSYHLDLDTVPTLLRVVDGREVERTVGWSAEAWGKLTGISDLGDGLPPHRPGCGSKSVEPGVAEALAVRFGGSVLRSRRVDVAELEDEHEAMFERGWTDGLPVVPPTEARVLRMLGGTDRPPDEVVVDVPPDLVPCTVEKVAVNAVMAGCLPEHLPVVLAAVEAACTPEFNMHGVLSTTWFSGPVVIVNGPIAEAIGMNSGINAMGQGNRANATIGRALQLVVRNVGGGRPGGVDRATLGQPGKYTFCFAEAEETSPWEPLSASRGVLAGVDAVTLFAGSGVQGVVDQLSRTPESLARSFAACLRTVAHPKLPIAFDAVLVVSPEHARVFADAGWSRDRLLDELHGLLQLPGAELVRGAGGIAEGVPEHLADATLPKFRPGGLLVAHAGGGAGLFSAIVAGWASGDVGSSPVTRPIHPQEATS
ncbi:MAG TPA: thioredoxin family protein [Acidimicrobiales bacterium]|nr:thioredoxin family protein [Acidimicrobiales bacterium]